MSHLLSDLPCWPCCMEMELKAHCEVRDVGRGLHVGNKHPSLRKQLRQSLASVSVHEHGDGGPEFLFHNSRHIQYRHCEGVLGRGGLRLYIAYKTEMW